MPSEAELQPYYDAHVEYASVPAGLIHTGLERLELPKPRTILDLGCGDGRIVDVFPDAEVLGVDYSIRRIAVARRRDRDRFACRDLHDFLSRPPSLYRFDLVTMFEVLEHLDDPAQTVTKARQFGPVLASVPYDWPDPAHQHVWSSDHELQDALAPDAYTRVGDRWFCHWEAARA